MRLADWRKGRGLSLRGAAQHISKEAGASISHAYVDKLERGECSVSVKVADIIKRGTGGEVTRLDWPEVLP